MPGEDSSYAAECYPFHLLRYLRCGAAPVIFWTQPGAVSRAWGRTGRRAMGDGMAKDLREAALAYHRSPKPGKLEISATKPLANQRDLALAYSPGVAAACDAIVADPASAEEHTSELQSLMRQSYAVFRLTKKKK